MNTAILLRRRSIMALALAMLVGTLPAAVQAADLIFSCQINDKDGKQVEIAIAPGIREPLGFIIYSPLQADAEAKALEAAKQKTATAASAHCRTARGS